MDTWLVAGAAVPAFDSQIPHTFEEDPNGPSGTPFSVAVKNHAGQVYRIFEGWGGRDLIDLVETLKKIGLADELEHAPFGQRHDHDAIMRPAFGDP